MKKIIALLLVAVMFFSLAACGENQPQTDNNGSQQEKGGTEDYTAITQGKTLVVVGKEYTTQKGNIFKINKIKLTDETNATFHLYFTYENKSNEYIQGAIGDIMGYANGEKIQISWYYDVCDILPNASDDIYISGNSTWDKEFSFTKVEEAAKQNGIFYFTIDETEYYIEIKAFLNAKA